MATPNADEPKPKTPKENAADHKAAGHSLADMKACLADFKKQGRADKVAYYESVIAAWGK